VTLYDPAALPPPGRGNPPGPRTYPEEGLAALVTHHVVIPMAIIAMVAALLFYLVDVRSAFLGGGPSLKWIGLCFATATVLTERYRRSSDLADLEGCYKMALAGATVLALLIEPWETRSSGLLAKLANLLIIAAVWRFATGITGSLSPEAEPDGELRFLRRLHLETSLRANRGVRPEPTEKRASAVPPNPAAAVARLAAVALLAFALGEPILLEAAPHVGERALAAVIVFLLATGVTLAAGSSMGTLRRVERAGGSFSPNLVAGRVGLAAVLMVIVLAAALAVPGIEVRGTGRLRPPAPPGTATDSDGVYLEGETPGGTSASPTGEQPGNPRAWNRGPLGPPRELLGETGLGSTSPFLGGLTSLGKWLLVPLILALVAAGLYALVRLAPRLKGWAGKAAERWRAFLARITERFRSRDPRSTSKPGPDPLEHLDHLASLPAREAVLAAYHALLATCGRLGHPRPERSTPYEFLHALPSGLRSLESPARTLTDLYVNAAYGPGPVPPEDRDTALGALAIIKAGLG